MMSEPNPDLLRAYMMRGAATGPAEAEKPPMKYCAGKLDNGRPCRIVMLGDEDYCQRHKKEIEALEAGAPLPIGRVERQEDEEMAKRGICWKCEKDDVQLVAKGMCWKCRENAIKDGTYDAIAPVKDQLGTFAVIHDVNKLETKPATKTVISDNVLQSAVHENMDSATSFGIFAVGMGDDTENLSHAPAAFAPPPRATNSLGHPEKGPCRSDRFSPRISHSSHWSAHSVHLRRIGHSRSTRSHTRSYSAVRHHGPGAAIAPGRG